MAEPAKDNNLEPPKEIVIWSAEAKAELRAIAAALAAWLMSGQTNGCRSGNPRHFRAGPRGSVHGGLDLRTVKRSPLGDG